MLFRRITAVLALALGVVGLVACAAGVYAVWRAEARFQRANERAFDFIDRGLEVGLHRVRGARERVEQSRITTSEITHKLRDWATRKAEDRLLAQLEVERRADRLAGQISAAEQWLEATDDSIRNAQQLLELSRSLGAGVDPGALEQPLSTLGSIRAAVQEAGREVEEIRELAALGIEADENRLARVLKLLARVVVTVTEIGPRLGRLEERISGARADSRELATRTHDIIRWVAVGATAILAWIAAGQAALSVWGWNRCRRDPRG